MEKKNDGSSRRMMLKTTSSALITAGAFSTTGAASTDTEKGCDQCGDVEVLTENETHQITRVKNGGNTFTFQVNKKEGSATAITVDEPVATEDIRDEDDVNIQNHDTIIERSDYDVDTNGDCNGHIYDSEYSITFTFETGDALDDYPSGTIEAALCTVIGAAAGSRSGYVGIALAALGAIVCFSIGYFFLDHIDYSGKSMAVGGWDCHTGWLNEEGVCTGVANSYTTDDDDLDQARKIRGAHLSVGEDITDHITIS